MRIEENTDVSAMVNGHLVSRIVPARVTLADFLREFLGLTGTHLGCEQGVCGACTVLVDGRSTRSCLTLAAQITGSEVYTIEGLNDCEDVQVLQRMFGEYGALQCGFCTPGFLVASVELLRESSYLSDREVRDALSGNICRCTGYQGIVDAVLAAAQQARSDCGYITESK